MRILIIRHGLAADAEAGSGSKAQDDALRELTKDGRRKMRKAARGLSQIVPSVDLVASSPLVRAFQTADIVASAFGGVRVVQIAALAPRKPPAQLLDWINAHPAQSTIALVGHEPHLSTFLCWILTELEESFVSLKKGGAALIETDMPVAAGRGKLLWVMKPSQLRKMQ
jgi:phosphohistidine phosphatase